MLTLTTAQFRDFAGISSQEWRGIVIASLVGAIVWFLVSLKWALTAPSLDHIVRQLKEGSRRLSSEDKLLGVTGDDDFVVVSPPALRNGSTEELSLVERLQKILLHPQTPVVDVPDDISNVLRLAQEAFRRELIRAPNPALDMLVTEKIDNTTSAGLNLGYAPDGWDYLLKGLAASSNPEMLHQAGLVAPRKEKAGYFDRFRNRLMIPVMNRRKVMGFAGVSLDGSEPRVLFSPEAAHFSRVGAIDYLKSKPELRVLTGY